MTIDELIQRLEDYRDAIGGDAEVRLMTQQNWPFENEIVGLASGEEINDRDDVDDTLARIQARGRVAGTTAINHAVEKYAAAGVRLLFTAITPLISSAGQEYIRRGQLARG